MPLSGQFGFARRCAMFHAAGIALATLLTAAAAQGANAYQQLQTTTNLRAVYFLKIPTASSLHVQLIIGAGEVDGHGPEGIAHLVEHLVMSRSFAATRRKPSSHSANASTNATVTSYYASGTPDELRILLEKAAGTLAPLDDAIGLLQREQNVVAREYEWRVSQNVFRSAYERLSRSLYQDHPLARSVMGTPVSVRAITPRIAMAFHRRLYRAANATLIVTGNVEQDDVLSRTNQAFGNFAATHPPRRMWQHSPPIQAPHKTHRIKSEVAKQPVIMIRTLFGLAATDRRSALVMLPMVARVLASAMPEGLELPLRHDEYLVDQFQVRAWLATNTTAELQFSAVPAPGIKPERIRRKIMATVRHLALNGLSQKTISRIVRRTKLAETRNHDRVAFQASRAAYWAAHQIAPPSKSSAAEHLIRLRKADFDRLVSSLAAPIRIATAIVSPVNSGAYR